MRGVHIGALLSVIEIPVVGHYHTLWVVAGTRAVEVHFQGRLPAGDIGICISCWGWILIHCDWDDICCSITVIICDRKLDIVGARGGEYMGRIRIGARRTVFKVPIVILNDTINIIARTRESDMKGLLSGGLIGARGGGGIVVEYIHCVV